jgi:hypothetical protein
VATCSIVMSRPPKALVDRREIALSSEKRVTPRISSSAITSPSMPSSPAKVRGEKGMIAIDGSRLSTEKTGLMTEVGPGGPTR